MTLEESARLAVVESKIDDLQKQFAAMDAKIDGLVLTQAQLRFGGRIVQGLFGLVGGAGLIDIAARLFGRQG